MATPNPERELGRLRAVLGRGVPRLLLISGPAAYFRDQAVDMAIAAVADGVELRRISGDADTDGAELGDLLGGSLFGAGACVVVRRGEGWLQQHGPALAAMLERIAKGCALVVEVVKLDRRTKVGKALTAAAEVFEFRALYTEPYDRTRSPQDAEMVGWIVDRGRAQGLSLTAEAALLMMHTVGSDPAECQNELVRLAPLLGGQAGAIPPEALAPALHCGYESNPFELAEALLDFDRARTERSLEAMLARGVRSRDGSLVDRGGVFPFATSWLYTALAKAYEGRLLLERGHTPRQVAQALGVRVFVDRFHRQVQTNPTPRLRRGLLLLYEAQRDLRETGEDPGWLLRRFAAGYFAETA